MFRYIGVLSIWMIGILLTVKQSAFAESPLRKLMPAAEATTLGVQTASYGLAGLAAIGLGTLAFFGRFKWSWFFVIVGGLFVISFALTIVETLGG